MAPMVLRRTTSAGSRAYGLSGSLDENLNRPAPVLSRGRTVERKARGPHQRASVLLRGWMGTSRVPARVERLFSSNYTAITRIAADTGDSMRRGRIGLVEHVRHECALLEAQLED